MPPRPIGDETRPLLVGIGQFDEGVGQFDAADEQLEPLGDARIGRIAARQRGLRGRPVREEGGMRAAELRLDPLQQQAEEQVLPGLARRAGATPAAAASAGASPAVASTSAPTWRANASATVRRSMRREVGGDAAAGHDRRQHGAQKGRGLVDQRSSMSAPGRYHSSMVNSAACRSLPSPFRHTRASWKIGPAPPTSSFFMANSGLVCSQSGSRAAVRVLALGAEGAQMHLLAGARDRVGGFDLGVAARE